MKQRQWKLITILIAFMTAISFSMSIFVYAQTPEEQRKKKEQQQQEQHKQQQQKLQQEQLKKEQGQQRQQQQEQQQKRQQEQLKKQQEQQKQKQQQEQQRQQQRPTGPTSGGPKPGTQPQTGQPTVQKHRSQSGMQPGQPGTPGGQQPDQHRQRPTGQPGAGPTQGQPGAKAVLPGQGQNQTNMNVRQRTTVNRTTITIKQPPQERQRVLTERHTEIRPEHNARAAVRFQSERTRFKPVSRVVVHYSPEIHRRVFEKHHFHPETYHARRASFYEAYRFHTPAWAFGLQPRFGLWDTPALAFILAHGADEQYALWYYSHRYDSDVIAWRQEMDRLAAANADLADQLAVMDARTWELQERGVPVDNSYVPPEMEDIALAAEVAVPMQDQNNQAPPPDQPQQYQQYQESQQYQEPQQYQQPAPLRPPVSYRKAADIGFTLSAAERKGHIVTLTVRLKNMAADRRSVALYDDSYSWPKSHLIDASGRSYEVREVYFRKGAERISIYDTGKTGIPIDGGATVTAHLVFKQISDGSRRATLNLHPFIYYGRSWTEHDVDFPDIVLK
jgi:hypothetical protein